MDVVKPIARFAGVILVNIDFRFLFQDRKEKSKHGEQVTLFSGRVENGETDEECMFREGGEEFGMSNLELLPFDSSFIPPGYHINGKPYRNVHMTTYLHMRMVNVDEMIFPEGDVPLLVSQHELADLIPITYPSNRPTIKKMQEINPLALLDQYHYLQPHILTPQSHHAMYRHG